jgi:hypothetical protein
VGILGQRSSGRTRRERHGAPSRLTLLLRKGTPLPECPSPWPL